jgi:hypothetical protein
MFESPAKHESRDWGHTIMDDPLLVTLLVLVWAVFFDKPPGRKKRNSRPVVLLAAGDPGLVPTPLELYPAQSYRHALLLGPQNAPPPRSPRILYGPDADLSRN